MSEKHACTIIHTCTPKSATERPEKQVPEALANNLAVKPAKLRSNNIVRALILLRPMFPFYTPHLCFSGVFRGFKMGTLVSNRLKNKQFWSDIDKAIGNVSSLKKISNEKIKLKEKIASADESLKGVLETKKFYRCNIQSFNM